MLIYNSRLWLCCKIIKTHATGHSGNGVPKAALLQHLATTWPMICEICETSPLQLLPVPVLSMFPTSLRQTTIKPLVLSLGSQDTARTSGSAWVICKKCRQTSSNILKHVKTSFKQQIVYRYFPCFLYLTIFRRILRVRQDRWNTAQQLKRSTDKATGVSANQRHWHSWLPSSFFTTRTLCKALSKQKVTEKTMEANWISYMIIYGVYPKGVICLQELQKTFCAPNKS